MLPLMIDLAILGLLTEQELHGYELKKRLGELLASRASISFGSLYPALARLEAQGAVKAVEERTVVPSAPMTGSLAGELAAFKARVRESGLVKGGRGKKVYGITDLGRERLVELLSDPDVSDDRAFTLRVAFAGQLEPAARLELFEHRTRSTQHDLEWIDELIAEERTQVADPDQGAASA